MLNTTTIIYIFLIIIVISIILYMTNIFKLIAGPTKIKKNNTPPISLPSIFTPGSFTLSKANVSIIFGIPSDRQKVANSEQNKYDEYIKLMDDLTNSKLFNQIMFQNDNNNRIIDLFKIKYNINGTEYFIEQPDPSIVPKYDDIIKQIDEKLAVLNNSIKTTGYMAVE